MITRPTFRGILRRGRHPDAGASLVLVVGSMVIMATFAIITLTYALSSTESARRGQDAKTAEAAAQAGIDEYISRLTADSSYWTLGNNDSTNAAFTTGQRVQGTSDGATYTYKVLSTAASTATDGTVRLQVTGTSGPGGGGHTNISRTLIATLRVNGFLQYIYLSDIEVVDPSFNGDPAGCARYYYAGRSGMSTCTEIQWSGADTVNGPLHSNDALQITGPVNFTNVRTESSWPAINGGGAKTWWGTQNPPLAGRSPVYAATVGLPTTNASMLSYVSPDVTGTGSSGPGCYYQGATEIEFNGTSMRVRSPMTSRPDTPARCLNVATRSQWQTISPIPPVIYVDAATSGTCTTGNTSAFTYPIAGESYTAGASSAVSWGHRINYNCMRGSAYIQGTVASSTTITAADDVVVTANLTVDSLAGSTVTGLIAGNCLWVYNPVDRWGNNLLPTPVNRIDAAILALRHSYLVENWDTGGLLGTMNINGSIAQAFRGPVATSRSGVMQTGYAKNYVYDTRLANLQPPYFLQPTTTPWRLVSLVDG